MMNINMKINHELTHLPLKQIRGSVQQRLDKVTEISHNFMGNIESVYDTFGYIKTKTFKNVLKQTAKAQNVQVQIGGNSGKTGQFTYTIGDEAPNIEGYTLFVPASSEGGLIPQTAAPAFMKLAFTFFNKIFNPKIIKRELDVSKYDFRTFKDFYKKNIAGTNKFTKEELHLFLQGRPAQEKIDLLQIFRYYMTEQLNANRIANECKARFDKKFKTKTLDRFPAFKIKEHNFSTKIKLVEAELAQTLKEERANLTNF